MPGSVEICNIQIGGIPLAGTVPAKGIPPMLYGGNDVCASLKRFFDGFKDDFFHDLVPFQRRMYAIFGQVGR